MDLKDGNLFDLVRNNRFVPAAGMWLYEQMLGALDCLASHTILHRDVKPENILYTSLPNDEYRFQLSDFGLCKLGEDARSYRGTRPYMAPEILDGLGREQTPKVDVWSLFITFAWVYDAEGYRNKKKKNNEQILKAARAALEDEKLIYVKAMGIEDPKYRASAAQMLVKHFKARGLSTPRRLVPDYSEDRTMDDVGSLPPASSDTSMLDVSGITSDDVRNAVNRSNRSRNEAHARPFQRLVGPSRAQFPKISAGMGATI